MRIDIVSIFPEYLAPLGVSLIGKAAEQGILDIRVHDLRTWTHDRHKTVDDSPCGGGPGMVDEAGAVGRGAGRTGSRRFPGPNPARGPDAVRPSVHAARGRGAGAGRAPRLRAARHQGIDRLIEATAKRMPVDELSIGDYV